MGVYNEYLFLLSFCILHAYGDESCPGCPDISCSNFPCSINELCYLKKVSCVAEPCPGIPYCIMPNKICKDGTPVIDDTGGAVTCESNCEPLQECVNGFCCNSAASVSPSISDLDVVDIETDLNMGDGNFPPKFLFPDLYGNIDKEEKKQFVNLANCHIVTQKWSAVQNTRMHVVSKTTVLVCFILLTPVDKSSIAWTLRIQKYQV